MSKEAMKLALEFIEQVDYPPYDAKPVITALREALTEQQGFVSPGGGYVPAIPAQQVLDKMAKNARDIGLDYEPSSGTQVSKVWRDGGKLVAKQVPLEDFYKPAQQEPVAWAHKHINATLAAFGPGEAISMTQDTWAKLREAMSVLIEQPAQHRAWFTVDELSAWADKKLKENPQWEEQPAQVDPCIDGSCSCCWAQLDEQPAQQTDSYVQQVPDKCDRIVWRGSYYHLPLQPAQQEPVVFYRCNGCGHAYEQVHPTSCDCMEDGGFDRVEYYTSPPAQQGQVAWTLLLTGEHHGLVGKAGEKFVGHPEYYERVDVYTSPQRTWVELTDEEIPTLTAGLGPITLMPFRETKAFVRAISAKLREKNA